MLTQRRLDLVRFAPYAVVEVQVKRSPPLPSYSIANPLESDSSEGQLAGWHTLGGVGSRIAVAGSRLPTTYTYVRTTVFV